jgi:murein lipoprotein
MNTAMLKTCSILLLGGLLFGCASVQQADLDAVRAVAEQAAADAAAAQRAAADAQLRADDAMNAAEEARATSEATEARVDQVFKKSMYK